MKERPGDNLEREQQLVDALLTSMSDSSAEQAQSLVTSGLERLDEQTPEQSRNGVDDSRRSKSSWLAIAIATAALIVIGLTLQLTSPSRNAMAEITRSIDQASRDVGRHYVIKHSLRTADGRTGERESDLFVKGGSRLAINTRFGPAGRTLWLISNDGSAWVVPPVGPVLEGETENLVAWAAGSDDISTPYLHVSSLLERMRERYELEILPARTLDTERGAIECYVVAGQLKGESSRDIPDRIEMSSDLETGVAMQIVATWDLAEGDAGREAMTITFKDEIQLDNEYFTPDEHGGENRRRINFFSEGSQ